MNQYGIQFEVKNKPSLDPEFMPILKFNRAFLETAKKPVSSCCWTVRRCLEDSGGVKRPHHWERFWPPRGLSSR